MRILGRKTARAVGLWLSWAVAVSAARGVTIKANPGSNDLSDGANWVGGAVPTAGTWAVWDGALTRSSFTLGNDVQSYLGVRVVNPGTDVMIEAGHVLTLGAGGIDMGAAVRGLTLNNDLELVANQTFNVATTLVVGGTVNVESNVLAITGGGVMSFGGLILGGVGSQIIKSGVGTLTLGGVTAVGSLTLNGGVMVAEAHNLSGVVSLGGGTLNLAAASGGSFNAGVNAAGNATVARSGGTLSLNGAWTGGGVVNWVTTSADSAGTLTGLFANFMGTLAFGTSTGSLRLVGGTDKNLGNAVVDLGSSTFTLFTRDGGNQSIGGLAGGPGTSLRGASAGSSMTLTTYVIGGANGTATFAGTIANGTNSAPVAITKVGTGTLTLTSTASNYSGMLTISNGVLAANQVCDLGSGATMTLGNYAAGSTGTLRWTGGTVSLSRVLSIEATGVLEASNASGAVSVTGGAILYGGVNNTPRTLVLTGANTAVNTLDVVVNNNGGGAVTVVKNGGNTWQVTRTNNAFSGGTYINGGTLLVNGAGGKPLGTGNVTVGSGGRLAGVVSVGSPGGAQSMTVNAGGAISPGLDSPAGAIGMLHMPVLTMQAGAVVNLTLQDVPAEGDAVEIFAGGTLDLGASTAGNPIWVTVLDAAGAAFAHNGTWAIFTGVDAVSTDGAGKLTHLLGASFGGDSATLTNFKVANLPPDLAATFTVANPGTSSSIVLTLSKVQAAATWMGAGRAGDWGDSANWSGGMGVPGAAGCGVVLGAGTAGGVICLNGARHVATLTLEAGTNSGYSLAAGTGGKLLLDNGTGGAVVSASGVHGMGADVELVSATTVTVGTGTLTISGVVSSAGASLAVGGAGKVVVTGNGAHTGVTTITGILQLGNGGADGSLGPGAMVNNGQLVINRGGTGTLTNAISGAGTVTHAGAGTTTLTGWYSATGGLAVAAGRLVFAPTGGMRNTPLVVLDMGTLTVASGAAMDVTNHDVMIGNTTLGAVENMVLAGWGIGGAGAPAITSSTARGLGTTFLVPVEADEWLGNGAVGSGVGKAWDGVTITQANTVLVRYAFIGDLNLDGVVDGADFVIANANLGAMTPGLSDYSAAWRMGDVTLDGVVNGLDLATMAGNARAVMGVSLADYDGVPRGVPEAGTVGVLAVGVAGMLRRRRRGEKEEKQIGGIIRR